MKRCIIILTALFWAAAAWADLGAKPANAQGIEPSRAHIRRSPEAEALGRAAAQAVKDRDWRVAAENYQKAIELYSQYLINASVPDDKAEKDNHDLYWGVGQFCGDALRDMPPEGMKVYNEMFGPAAKHAFENAIKGRLDTDKLAQVAGLYTLTESGRQALALLMRRHLERGDLYKAFGYYRELKLNHPQAAQGLPERGLIEGFMAGRPSAVEWQAYCGDNTRSKMMPVATTVPSFSWAGHFKLPAHIINLSRRSNPPDIYFSTPIAPQESIPYFPVVNKGVIYLPTGSGIYAFELPDSRKDGKGEQELKVKWKVEYETSTTKFQDERVINTATLSADGRRLYLPLIGSFEKHEERLGFLDVKYPFPRRVLFCIDTDTAKVLWTSEKAPPVSEGDFRPLGETSPRRAPRRAQDGANPFEDIIFPVAPAEEDGVLYAAGIRMPNQVDIPEHYLFAINARSGEVYFKTFVASGILETNLFNNPSREPVASAVTVDKDNIYYCSQMGAIVAADKYSGQIKWLKKYEEYQIKPTWPNYTPPRLPLRWANNPIIRADNASLAPAKGLIIATAIDSPFLYMLSAENGEELWRWNGDDFPLGNVRYLVGIKDGLLAVSGEAGVLCLNLNKGGSVQWTMDGKIPFKETPRFVGKGAVTDDRICVISDNYILYEIEWKTGNLISKQSLQGKDEIQPSANLLVAGDLLIRNSIGQMNIYRIENKKEPVNVSPQK